MKYGENLYWVRWCGFKPDGDTRGKIKHLPQSKVIRFCKRKKIATKDDIDKANDGLLNNETASSITYMDRLTIHRKELSPIQYLSNQALQYDKNSTADIMECP